MLRGIIVISLTATIPPKIDYRVIGELSPQEIDYMCNATRQDILKQLNKEVKEAEQIEE